MCKCHNCGNPGGVRPVVQVKTRVKRKHAFQQDIPSSKRFAEDRHEELVKGVWSDIEAMLLNEIITKAFPDGQHSDRDLEHITKLFNEVVYYLVVLVWS